MDPVIFREYDIRAVVDKELDDAGVIRLGRAMGTYYLSRGVNDITLGHDCRLSSDRYVDLLTQGLTGAGIQVTDVGLVTTPMLYFSIHAFKKQGGVMITASHNPPQYNGFKICTGPHTISGAEIQEIRMIAEKGDFAEGKGFVTQADVATPYLDYLVKNIHIQRPITIGVDAGNGAGGPMALAAYQALGIKATGIYCDVDGRFPNHPPDPTVMANIVDLVALVKSQHLEVGIGFDGDGDRVGVVDERGRVIYGDRLLVIFAREILARRPGAAILGEVKCSDKLFRDIEQHGGRAVMWKTGHSLMKQKMLEEDAALGGEMSGHMFFADRFLGFDDALYASLRLIEIMSRDNKPLSEYLADVPEGFTTPEIRVDCPDHLKFALVEAVKEELRKDYRIIDIDGVRAIFDHGWGLVRASNTQPVIVMRFEADTEAELLRLQSLVEAKVAAARRVMG
ncbi:MAG: phosphomannomutase/phosphoglucomutase [Deltaproteobacteria bacterium]|nr:phosphomannomutase/phosphoglucomutase [Deltaproteobacteria bacterium]